MLYELRSVGRVFRRGKARLQALSNLSFEIDAGEHVALVGPSGSGKTTLLNILGLLDSEHEGELRFGGASMAEMSATEQARTRLRDIGFVFQGFHLLQSLTVMDNVAVPHWHLHGSRKAARKAAGDVLAQVGLESRMLHRSDELSGGEMQRTAVARAMINEPRVILADEPTGNLDAENAGVILELFAELNRAGTTLIVVSHNLLVAKSADRMLRLGHGIIQPDSPLPTDLQAEA